MTKSGKKVNCKFNEKISVSSVLFVFVRRAHFSMHSILVLVNLENTELVCTANKFIILRLLKKNYK